MIKLSPLLRPFISRKRVLAGLVSAATVATLTLASTAFADSPAPSASRSAEIAARAQAVVRVTDPAVAKAPVPPSVRAALETLVEIGFSPGNGYFGDTFWRNAVAMSTMESYRQTTGDTTYDYTFNNYYLHAPAMFFEDNLDDDTGWWGLALLQDYSITRDLSYLKKAEALADYIHQDWNTNASRCGGGGVPEHRSPEDGLAGAINNELFLELTAGLHYTIVDNHLGSDSGSNSYLSWAMQEWAYFQKVQLFHAGSLTVGTGAAKTIIPAYLVPNSSPSPDIPVSVLCGTNSIRYDLFTYNQGVILDGLAYLYQDTGDAMYLTDAEHIANAVLKPPTPLQVVDAIVNNAAEPPKASNIFTYFGVLNDPTSPLLTPTSGLGDGAAFKGIFVRDLRTLDNVIASTTKDNAGPACTATYNNKSYDQCTTLYNDFFTAQVCPIENVDTLNVDEKFKSPDGWGVQPYRLMGYHWTGPDTPYDLTTQVSAVEALVAAVDLPAHGAPFPDCQRTQRSSAGASSAGAGRQRQPVSPSHAVQAVERCYEGWYRMSGCREEPGFGRYLAPVRRGQFFHAHHEQFSRRGARQQDD